MATAAELSVIITSELSGKGFDAAEKATKDLGGSLGGLGKKLGKLGAPAMVGGAAAAGAIAGIGIAGLNAANDIGQSQENLRAQLGVTAEEAERLGGVGLEVFKNNWGDSIGAATAAVGGLEKAFGGEVTSTELEHLTQQAFALEQAFNFPVEEQTTAIGILNKSFDDALLNGEQSFDAIAKLMQDSGGNADDLLETIGEYAPLMADLGMSSEEFFGVLSQGLQAGARDTDFVADLFKEFGIRIMDGSGATYQALAGEKGLAGALRDIGALSGDASLGGLADELDYLIDDLETGGVTAAEAFDKIQEGLSHIEDPIKRNQIGVALMGTKYEDLGADVVGALSIAGASMGEFEGTALEAGDNMNKNFGSFIEGIKRNFTVGLGEAFLPLQEQIEDKLPEIMDKVMPVIEDMMGTLSELLANIDIDALVTTFTDDLLPALTGVFDFIKDNAKVIGIVAGAFAALSTVAAVLAPVFMVLGPVVSVLGTAIGIVGSVLAPVIGLFSGAAAAGGAGAGLLGVLTTLGGVVSAVASVITFPLIAVILAVVAAIAIWKLKGDEIKAKLSEWAEKVKEFSADIKEKWDEMVSAVTEKLGEMFAAVTEKFTAIKTAIQETLAGILSNLKLIWDSMLREVVDKLKKILDSVTEKFTEVWNAITSALDGIFDAIKTGWNAYLDLITDVLGKIKDVVDRVLDLIKGVIQFYIDAWKAIFEKLSELVARVKAILIDVKDKAVDFVMGLIETMISNYIANIKKLFEIGQALYDKMTTALGRIKDAVTDIFAEGSDLVKKIISAGKDIVLGLWKGFTDQWDEFLISVMGLATGLVAKFLEWIIGGSPAMLFAPVGASIAEGIGYGFIDAWQDAVVGPVKRLITDLPGATTIGGPGAVGRAIMAAIIGPGGGLPGMLGGSTTIGGPGEVGHYVPPWQQWGTARGRPGTHQMPGVQYPVNFGGAGLGGVSALIPSLQAPESPDKWDELLRYIKGAAFGGGGVGGNSLAQWMRGRGFSDEEVMDYRDLHRQRDRYGWKTEHARQLYRRRVMPTRGTWGDTGTGMTDSDESGLSGPGTSGRPMLGGGGGGTGKVVVNLTNTVKIGDATTEVLFTRLVGELSRFMTFAPPSGG